MGGVAVCSTAIIAVAISSDIKQIYGLKLSLTSIPYNFYLYIQYIYFAFLCSNWSFLYFAYALLFHLLLIKLEQQILYICIYVCSLGCTEGKNFTDKYAF